MLIRLLILVIVGLVAFSGNRVTADSDNAGSVTSDDAGNLGIDVESFIQTWYSQYIIDTSGAEPTIEILVYPPYDTCFLGSIGQFIGPKTGNLVGLEIPIKRIGLLSHGRNIRFTYVQQAHIPERWYRVSTRDWGRLVIEPCQALVGWFPVSLVISCTDSSQTSDPRSVTIKRSSDQGWTETATHHLPPGIYSCIFELDSVDVLFEGMDSTQSWVKRCDKVIVHDIRIRAGYSSIITTCEFLGIQVDVVVNGQEAASCRFPWLARETSF